MAPTLKGRELTFKQRVRRRCKTAYCARHVDIPDLWCVFLRRSDTFATAIAFKINDAWREAARAIHA